MSQQPPHDPRNSRRPQPQPPQGGYGQPPPENWHPPQGQQPYYPPQQGYPQQPQYPPQQPPPYYPPPQPLPPKKKRGGFGKVLLITLGVIVGLFVLLVTVLSARSPGSAGNAPTFAANATHTVPDVRELKKSPDQFKRQPIQLTGEVFRINESGGNTDLQMWVQVPGGGSFEREAVYVNYRGTLAGVYAKSVITVYGVGDGTTSGNNALGGTITQPLVTATRIETIAATAAPTSTARRP